MSVDRGSAKLRGRASAAGILWMAMFLFVTTPLRAQAPELDRAEELARMGRTEEARAILGAWWDGTRGDSSRRDLQRGLWLRGRLTVDPAQAELDYQRLVVLYPSGPYTPQAILRLAQAAHAQGDGEAAQRHVATLVRDYPTSTSRTEAEAWLREAGPAPARPAGAAVGASTPTAPSASAQGTATAGTAPDSAGAPIRPSVGRPTAPADLVLDWFVQFGAFSDEERAFALQSELVDAGVAARLVRVQGSGFFHVRLGRFATRDDAGRQLQEVTRQGFTAAIVRDDRAEEVVRR